MSKGKGLSLIQPRHSISDNDPRNLTMTQQIRFSLAEIENVNFDYDSIKASFQFTPQNQRNKWLIIFLILTSFGKKKKIWKKMAVFSCMIINFNTKIWY